MERKKLISVRLNADTLAAIDELCKHVRYVDRSAVINNILGNMVCYATPDDFRKVATHWTQYRGKLVISVKYCSM